MSVPVPSNLPVIPDEHYLLYQRFSYRLATWHALGFLLMIFESSFLAIAAFVIVYLRGKHASLNLDISSVPDYAVFVVTSTYPFLKIIWLGLLYIRARKEMPVSKKLA